MPKFTTYDQADIDALASRITALETGKASQSALDSLAQIIAGKADQAALDALAARVTAIEAGEPVPAPAPDPSPTPSPTPDPTPVPPPPPAQYGASLNEEEPPLVSGNVARYGGSEYSTLIAAINAAAAGGVVEILPGGHAGVSAVPQGVGKAITIRGIRDSQGRAPVLDATNVSIIKSILNPRAASIVVEHLTLRGAKNTSLNGAGIWPEPICQTMTLRFVICRGNQNGILTPTDSDFSDLLLVEDSLFYANGSTGGHNLYIGWNKEAKFVRTTFRDQSGGHTFKSRALRTIMDRCLVEDRQQSRSIDIPVGGYFHFANGKIVKYETANGQMDLIGFNPESQSESQNRVDSALVENSILDGRLSSHVIFNNYVYSSATAILRGNTYPNSRKTLGLVTIQ